MKYLKIPVIALSVIICLGGAANSGGFYFIPAIPFMILLMFLVRGYEKRYRTMAAVFITICIFTSVTRDWNPFFYPILIGGTATVLEDGYQITYSDGSGGFRFLSSLEGYIHDSRKEDLTERLRRFVDDPFETVIMTGDGDFSGIDNVTIKKIKRGNIFRVTGISHDHSDFGDDINVVTTVGEFFHSDTDPGDGDYAVRLDGEVQSGWSRALGNLMRYPVYLIILLSSPSELL